LSAGLSADRIAGGQTAQLQSRGDSTFLAPPRLQRLKNAGSADNEKAPAMAGAE